jgi:hypothetical protein
MDSRRQTRTSVSPLHVGQECAIIHVGLSRGGCDLEVEVRWGQGPNIITYLGSQVSTEYYVGT